jgi:small subunit ribosomal protein S16
MVKIRLTRTGRKHQPHYRIVAVDSRAKRDGKYIEKIGYYNPRTSPPTFQIDKEILKKWMNYGAQLTDTVYDLLLREKIITKKDKLREKRIKLMIKQNKTDKVKEEKASSPPKASPKLEVTEEKDNTKKEGKSTKIETPKEKNKPNVETKKEVKKEK